MRISDWSSDVCSSDLHEIEIDGLAAAILTGHLGLSGRLTLGDGRRGHAEAQRKHAGGEEVLQRQRHRGESLLSRSEEHTSELQSLMRISYAVFCLKKKQQNTSLNRITTTNYRIKHYNHT